MELVCVSAIIIDLWNGKGHPSVKIDLLKTFHCNTVWYYIVYCMEDGTPWLDRDRYFISFMSVSSSQASLVSEYG